MTEDWSPKLIKMYGEMERARMPTVAQPVQVSQHIGWLKQYAAVMNENNWRDMRALIDRQLIQLSDLLASQPPAAPVDTEEDIPPDAEHPANYRKAFSKSAPGSSAPHNTGERPPSRDAADTGADTRSSAGTASTRDGIAAIISDQANVGVDGYIGNADNVADAILKSFPVLDQPQEAPDIAAGMTKAMEIVGEMRMSEAGIFDEKHSGQRGEDRSNAL